MGNIYRVLAKKDISSPSFFPTRLVIEDCENIHLHIRNLRIEFSTREFINFVGALNTALKEFRNWGTPMKIAINEINPYDKTHLEGFENTNSCHREGIEKVKQLIKIGKKILPILIKKLGKGKFQRLDGFKRYFAFKELGYKQIECYLVNKAKPGDQEGQSWIKEN